MVFRGAWHKPRSIIICNDNEEEVEVKIDSSHSLALAEEKAIAKAKREGKIKGDLHVKKPKGGVKR